MPCRESATRVLESARTLGLLSACEADAALGMFDPTFAFAEQLQRSDSIHLHVKVDDTQALPRDAIGEAGGRVDHEKEGFVKFCFDGGIHLIFSSIAVSQDELQETETAKRKRPFVDHFGIDLRAETKEVEVSFTGIPAVAGERGWGHVPQGSPDRGVHCCHVEVKKKHWVYPRGNAPAIPLEFAFGELKMNPVSGGCDLRPLDPQQAAAAGATTACSAAND